MIKSKKGDIPVTILVLGVILICLVTLASFYISIIKTTKNFDIQAIKEIKLIKEKSDFYHNLGFTDQKIQTILGVETKGNGQDYVLLTTGPISIEYDFP